MRKTTYERLQDPSRSFKYPFTFLRHIPPTLSEAFSLRLHLYDWCYVAVRAADDESDEGFNKKGERFLEEEIEFLNDDRHSANDFEELLLYISHTAEKLGANPQALRGAFSNIFQGILWDVRRAKRFRDTHQPELFSEIDIAQYVRGMEFDGVFKLILEIFGENPQDFEAFFPLILAARRNFYLLRDVIEDTACGRVNIPREQFPDFSDNGHELILTCQEITILPNQSTEQRRAKISRLLHEVPSLRPWFDEQINSGYALLDQYRKNISFDGLGIFTRILLAAYEIRTRLFFRQMSGIS